MSPRWRRVWDALLTGVPFGIYKLGSGYYLWTYTLPWLGCLFMAWGFLDLATNLAAALWPRPLPYCFLSALGRYWGQRGENLALAVDTLLSFSIVSVMIWYRCFPELGFPLRRLWELATITQVLGVGLMRVISATRA